MADAAAAGARFVPKGTAPTKSLRYARGSIDLLVNENLGASLVDFRVNTILAGSAPGPYHLHNDVENMYYVLHGRLVIRTEDGEREIGPGDAVFFPRGVPHSTTNVGPDDARIIEIYAPCGPDFVELED